MVGQKEFITTSELRALTADDLREMKYEKIITEAGESLAVIMPIELYMAWEFVIQKVGQL